MTALNFLPHRPPLTGWRLALLGIAVLMLIPAAVNWATQMQTASRLQARLAAISSASQTRHLSRPALAPAQQHELDAQVKAVAEAVRQLNLPVTRLIKTMQAPADIRIALLGLDLNGQPTQDTDTAAPTVPAGDLKIAGEAEAAQDMINYLAFLNQQPMFRSVYLLKHETTANGAYRFQMEAQWRQ